MTRTIDPAFSTRPAPSWMTGLPSPMCNAVNGPDDPENGVDGSGTPQKPEPESAIAGMMDLSSFTAFSPNIPRGTPPLQLITWSPDNKVIEFKAPPRSLFQLAKSAVDLQTGLRRAILVPTSLIPFELSTILYSAGQRDYVYQHVDEIVFCPFIAMMDLSIENVVHVPDVAIYIQDDVGSERKLLINLYKPIYTDRAGITEFVSRLDFEIFPDIIDGAVRLHIMTNVINGREPADHLELLYIRKMSIPFQISAINATMNIYKNRGLAGGKAYEYLRRLKRKLAVELRQLERG